MQNKPNFLNAKIAITLIVTMTTNYKPPTTNYPKQTQTNPILPAVLSGVACLSAIAPVLRRFIEGGCAAEAKENAQMEARKVKVEISSIDLFPLFAFYFLIFTFYFSKPLTTFQTITYAKTRPQIQSNSINLAHHSAIFREHFESDSITIQEQFETFGAI